MKIKKLKPGYYIDHLGDIAIVYPNDKVDVWFSYIVNGWRWSQEVFTNNGDLITIQWKFIGDL